MTRSQLAEYLQGMEFPVSRERLAGRLMSRTVPSEVIESMMRQPTDCFESPDAVIRALGVKEG